MESLKITYLMFLLANLLVLGVSTVQNTTSFLQCLTLQYQNSNIIYTSDNMFYSSIFESKVRNQRASTSSTQRPLAIIVPTQESQIQALINCLKEHDIQIRVRSGGHDYEGLSYISNKNSFVMLDMRNFQSISVNTTDNTTWVQAGATLGQLYYTIAQTSTTLAYPAGACPTVGIGGHLSGGGYGMISRKHGMSIDHIIDARIIDTNGRILERNSMGEDLFWAIRGGGGTSFGIVIAFKIELVHVPETVTVFNVTRTLEQNATQLVHKWQYVSHEIDEKLLIRLFLKSVRNRIDGNITIQASFISLFLGRVDDLLQVMQEKFPEMGLVAQDCTEMSWVESTLFIAGLKNESIDILLDRTGHDGLYYLKGKSDYVKKPIPQHGLTRLWEFLKEQEVENHAELQFSPYGGALSTFSDYETPFPHRKGNFFMIHYGVTWYSYENSEAESYLTWIRKIYSYMARYVSKSPRTAYFNYRDLDLGMNNERNTSYEQASVWGYKYFKNNFNRLVDVKTKVDPSNFFRNEQSIPPKEESRLSRASA